MRNALKLIVPSLMPANVPFMLVSIVPALLLVLPLSVLPAIALGAEAGSRASTDNASKDKETIVIRADRAWEEADGGQVLHFAGNFELISPEWELRSDEADLYGPLDDPARIVARGAPAYLTILDGDRSIEGEGLVIEYKRDEDVLVLRENAHLAGDDISMTSSEIVFDVGAERLRSSGTDGVEMVLERSR